MFVGFFVDVSRATDSATQNMFTVHFLLALATSVVVLFQNGVVVTYFIGTSRWCREVVATYRLAPALAAESDRLKRQTFPFSAANMLLVVALVSLGAAADPATAVPTIGGVRWADIHLVGVLAALVFMAYATFVQWENIRAHQQVIETILDRVRTIRASRGLDQDVARQVVNSND